MSNEPHVTAEYAKPVSKSGTSGKAITSLVFGLASFFCAFFTGIVAVIMGILALGDISKSRGRLGGNGLAITGIVTGSLGCVCSPVLIGLMLPAVQQVRDAARQAQSMNNMRQMTLCMLNYESAYGRFPLAEGREGEGLSWRVHILPFMEEMELYEQFHLDEPWDSPHNLTLVDRMPELFKNPNLMHNLPPGKTIYLIPTTPAHADPTQPRAIFVQGQPGPRFGDILDGASNTILILEADLDAAVTWTDPSGDWIYDSNDPMHSVGNLRPGAIVTAFTDGSTHRINKQMSPQEFNALITRDGGDAPPPMY